MNLWSIWMDYTYKKALAVSERDRYIYGTGYMIKKWWGYKRIHPSKVFLKR